MFDGLCCPPTPTAANRWGKPRTERVSARSLSFPALLVVADSYLADVSARRVDKLINISRHRLAVQVAGLPNGRSSGRARCQILSPPARRCGLVHAIRGRLAHDEGPRRRTEATTFSGYGCHPRDWPGLKPGTGLKLVQRRPGTPGAVAFDAPAASRTARSMTSPSRAMRSGALNDFVNDACHTVFRRSALFPPGTGTRTCTLFGICSKYFAQGRLRSCRQRDRSIS